MAGYSILVVDDEASIRKSLEVVLRDEGFEVSSVANAQEMLEVLTRAVPALLFLDIWMPGMDGLEALQQVKRIAPQLPVIMISGHATIATAIMATRLGAADFIEKPLDLHTVTQAVRRLLGLSPDGASAMGSFKAVASSDAIIPADARAPGTSEQLSLGRESAPREINRIVFKQQKLRGAKVQQHSLAHSTLLYGQGLHSGKKSGLILEPLPANSGIHFTGVSETAVVPAHVDYVESTGFATTVKLGATQAGTIEHLMSACHAYGIANLLIKCNGEVPVLDGSASEFCRVFESVGVVAQEGDWYEIAVAEPIRVGDGREFIQLEPSEQGFEVFYELNYPAPVGKQSMRFQLGSLADYKTQIAPARTFGFVKDIGYLQRQGLALGGRFDNFILFGDEGPINDQLRFPDEPVRHKILDALGDLYLLGRRIRGKVHACMTGHSDNIALLKALREKLNSALE